MKVLFHLSFGDQLVNIAQHLAANELAAGLMRSEETNRAKGPMAYIDQVTRNMKYGSISAGCVKW